MIGDNWTRITLPALIIIAGDAQAVEPADGTAIIGVDDKEYTIPIVCEHTTSPESGLYTEPQRVARERTGRASGFRLTIRPWQDTSDLMINLDRYVAWVPLPSTGDGVLELTLAMSPATSLQGGVPDALTYDDWIAGDRPEGFDGVRIEVNCKILDPDAPAFRKLPTAD